LAVIPYARPYECKNRSRAYSIKTGDRPSDIGLSELAE
jgi:hypothetical protein